MAKPHGMEVTAARSDDALVGALLGGCVRRMERRRCTGPVSMAAWRW
jgi:hypothetical protein